MGGNGTNENTGLPSEASNDGGTGTTGGSDIAGNTPATNEPMKEI
ncbi:hypothetical protein [Spirosoma humi]